MMANFVGRDTATRLVERRASGRQRHRDVEQLADPRSRPCCAATGQLEARAPLPLRKRVLRGGNALGDQQVVAHAQCLNSWGSEPKHVGVCDLARLSHDVVAIEDDAALSA
jgi:hypothetical protein